MKNLFKILVTLIFCFLFAVEYLYSQSDTREYDYMLIHGINSDGKMWNGSLIKSTINDEFKHSFPPQQVTYNDEKSISVIASDLKPHIESKTVDIGYRLLPSGIESYQRVNGRYRGIALLEDHWRLS
jgi:hypothetical protein